MVRKTYTPEQIINKLREDEIYHPKPSAWGKLFSKIQLIVGISFETSFAHSYFRFYLHLVDTTF